MTRGNFLTERMLDSLKAREIVSRRFPCPDPAAVVRRASRVREILLSSFRPSLATVLSVLLAAPATSTTDSPSVPPPSLRESLPLPSLTRDRLHAALEALAREDSSSFLAESPPDLSDEGILANAPVLAFGSPAAVREPTVFLIAASDDADVQGSLRRLFDILPPSAANVLQAPSFFSPNALAVLRASDDPALRRTKADLLLGAGVFSAAEHWFLTSESPVRLRSLQTRAPADGASQKFREAATELSDDVARAPGREFALNYLEALERVLDPVEVRALGLDLWALDKNRAAFESGALDASSYVQKLLERVESLNAASGASTRQMRRLAELSALEEDLDFEEALRERDRLIERLHTVLSARENDLLMNQTEAFAEGRLAPAGHARGLLRQAREEGIPQESFSHFFRFFRYAELAGELDFRALSDEIRRWGDDLLGAGRNNASQAALLNLARDERALRRTFETGAGLDQAPWSVWRDVPARADAAAQAVGLTAPQPAFPWISTLGALEEVSRVRRERNRAMADVLLSRLGGSVTTVVSSPETASSLRRAVWEKGTDVVTLVPLPGGPADGASQKSRGGAADLARAWGLPRLVWGDGGTSARAVAALWENLSLLLRVAGTDERRTPEPDNTFLRRFALRVRVGIPKRQGEGGEMRILSRGEGLPPVSLLWRWRTLGNGGAGPTYHQGGADGAGEVFHPLGEVSTLRGRRQLFVRPLPGFLGPWRWVQAQFRGAQRATRRFFAMQKEPALLAGIWMLGGLALSAFAGVVSAALVVSWMIVGVLVLVGVVMFGGGGESREGLIEKLKALWKGRGAVRERILRRVVLKRR